MNEQIAIGVLARSRYAKSFVLPRYTPKKWWECDLFEVTKAGYFREYEVKLTRADFFADSKKEQQVFPRPFGQPVVMVNKHQLLLQGDALAPCHFWYVTPVGLIKPEELPVWAGLIEIEEQGRDIPGTIPHRFEREVVKAPRIHNQKLAPEILTHARGVCYWRLHHLMAVKGAT